MESVAVSFQEDCQSHQVKVSHKEVTVTSLPQKWSPQAAGTGDPTSSCCAHQPNGGLKRPAVHKVAQTPQK
jgi:hypothetical protein